MASLKTLGGIGSIILGVVAILVSVGLQTIWAPPAEYNATTHDTEQAPLTLVTDDIDIDPDEAIEYTIAGDGDFTLMYGQLRDIEAWIGDAAYNRIDGVTTDVARGEDPTVDISYVDGESEVPNPANSDLWLATQEVDGEVTQRWTQHDAGQWALLIAADGTEPAPTDVSVSWVNVEPDSPLITPLMIIGIVLILLGIGLLLWRFMDFRRRAKRTSGRRAAVRGDYTGLTAADVVADTDTSAPTMTVEQVDAGEPVNNPDEQPTQVVAAIDPDESQTSSEQDEDDSDDTDDNASTTSGSDSSATKEETPDEDDHKGLLRRTAVGLTALSLGLGLGIGPAQATQSPEEEDISDQVEDDSAEDDVDSVPPETFQVVVDAQFDRIVNAVMASVANGDDKQDADVLTGRVDGQALRVREESYRNHDIDEDYALVSPLAADEILATWMEHSEDFPRTAYAVVADADGESTQLVVLRQDDPRSQYKLIHNAPFAPGAELPSGTLSDPEVENLANDDSNGLAMSPDAAVETLADYLSDQDADAADKVAQNDWIDSIHEHQDDLIASHAEQETEASITRSVFEDSVDSVRLPDGSALVFGAMNSMESLTPSEDTTVGLNDLTQQLGEFESTEQDDTVRIRYREQFALLVPQEGKVSLVGYETVQSTVDSPGN